MNVLTSKQDNKHDFFHVTNSPPLEGLGEAGF